MTAALDAVRRELRQKALQHVTTARVLLKAEGHEGSSHPLGDALGFLGEAEGAIRDALDRPEDPGVPF